MRMTSASCVLVLLMLAALNVNVVDCLSPLTSLRLKTSNAQAVTSSHLNANTNTLDVNANPNVNVNVNSREEDLEVTRQLIMAHFDKIDSCEDEDSEDSSFHACSSSGENKNKNELQLELATKLLLQSLMSVKSCANRIQNTARIVTANISIHLDLDPLTRMNQELIRKGRKAATATVSRAKIWDGATAGATFGSLLTMQFPSNMVTRVQLEKAGMKFVSVCSRILSLGQLEICFD